MAESISEVTGGYDKNFLASVPNFLQCIICHLALRNPIQMMDCGHRHCEICFQNVKYNAVMKGLDLLCTLNGIVIQPSKEHMSVDCLFEFETCKHEGCDVQMQRIELKEHLKCCLKQVGETDSKVLALMYELTRRMDNFEIKLKENNDKIIEQYQQQLQEKDDQIQLCNKKLEEIQDELQGVKQQMGVIINNQDEHELKMTGGSSSKISTDASTTAQQFQIQMIEKNVSSFQKEMENAVREVKKDMSLFMNCAEKVWEHSSRMDLLAKDHKILHVEVKGLKFFLNILTPENPVFTWVIHNYANEKSKGVTCFSPSFYSAVDGFHMKLFVMWYGLMRGKLGLYFTVFKSERNTTRSPFNRCINLKCQETTTQIVYDNKEYNYKDESSWSGHGVNPFLQNPRLKSYVVNDTLTIECWLS